MDPAAQMFWDFDQGLGLVAAYQDVFKEVSIFAVFLGQEGKNVDDLLLKDAVSVVHEALFKHEVALPCCSLSHCERIDTLSLQPTA